jgi:hypothetical protein
MSEVVYSIPAGLPAEEHWRSVVLRAPCVELLVEGHEKLKGGSSQVVGYILTLPDEKAPSRFEIDSEMAKMELLPEGLFFDIHAAEDELAKLYLWRIILSKLRTFVVLRFGPKLPGQVRQVSAMGYAVKLPEECFAKKNHKVILKIMNYYFHDKTLQVPIEPIHGLFKTWVRGKGVSLQEFYRRDADKYVVVGEDGIPQSAVSLRDGLASSSEIERRGTGRDGLFKGMNECSVCRAFRICGGICNLSYNFGDCDGIKNVAEVLGKESKAMLSAIREIGVK